MSAVLVSAAILQTAVVIEITVVLKVSDRSLLLGAKVVHTDLQVCILLRFELIAVEVDSPPRTLRRVRRSHVQSKRRCAFDLRRLLQIERRPRCVEPD